LFSACVPPVPAACGVTQKRYVHGTKSECPSRAPMSEARPKRRYARMKVLIGVDPHKASVAVAVVDEAACELVERAAFPQDRDGLRSLERFKRNGSPSVVGRWRTPAASVDTWQ
jgi:hypothetical protein